MPITMKILSTSDTDLAIAAEALRKGQLVAIPTETVYGLGANARDPHALARVFSAKERPTFDPLIIHVAQAEDADGVAAMDTPHAREMAAAFWPGPLTMVLPKRDGVPDLATSGLPTVAVRCPAHPVARRIIELAGIPVAAPSANPFGRLSPTTAGHVVAQLGDRIDYVVDGGPCEIGVESTVLDLSMDPPLILRPGGLSLERIAAILPNVTVHDRATTSPRAPGQLPSHYAPRCPLHLADRGKLTMAKPAKNAAALCFGKASSDALLRAGNFSAVMDLSPNGDPVEAAARLFATLHALDSGAYSELWAERLPDAGIGRAVNDRLYKASEKIDG